MSSVLKALKNQSSPLVQGSSDVRLQSAKVLSTGAPRVLLWLVMLVLAGVLGWLAVQWMPYYRAEAEATSKVELEALERDQRPSAAVQAQYQLGDMATIKTPQWPAMATDSAMATDVANASLPQQAQSTEQGATTAQQRDNQSPVNDNQAIDLSQISPQLLSAFESALAEGENGGDADNLNRSVVPELDQLAPSFRRTIPSFSYDGHQYSSRPQGRWIELSGVRLFEGERFEGLTVLTIAPAHVVFVKDNQAFSQPALEDWTKP
ncbi:MAG: general secretion pathway protein GspB [Gammaproteobacteria bacterium]|nr:general secretion pathway protein GspB [Gammaproteobacteria bacterium]